MSEKQTVDINSSRFIMCRFVFVIKTDAKEQHILPAEEYLSI